MHSALVAGQSAGLVKPSVAQAVPKCSRLGSKASAAIAGHPLLSGHVVPHPRPLARSSWVVQAIAAEPPVKDVSATCPRGAHWQVRPSAAIGH